MPKLTIIEQAQYQRMPWKNGLGETLEIQRHEDENGLRFRISQASVVENGIFSDFNGLHRTLVLLSGEGMTLEHKNEAGNQINKLNNPLDIARFSGGDHTYATLKNGKIEDLNIMVRDSDTQADVQACLAPCQLLPSNKTTLFCGFYANEETRLETADAEVMTIKAHSLIIFSQTTSTKLIQGRGVLVTLCHKTA